MSLLTLYPAILPNHHFTLAVSPLHTLYVEECGNPHGLPVVFLHGGPGAGCEAYHRQFFDPEIYRIILFDQRGCGRSFPHAELRENSTPELVQDIETLRQHLSIDKWVVFGGSWGSTLGLAYAETYPERVLGLILRGVFLCRDCDIHWFYQDGASRLFPDYWQDYIAPIPADERHDMLQAYHSRLTGEDEVARMGAARAWSVWEGRTATLRRNPSVVEHFGGAHVALSLARIENHYFINKSFLRPDQLLQDACKLQDIPGAIVHGRYDVVCPVDQAFALSERWPGANLSVIDDAGHSATEFGIVDALIRTTRSIGQLYSS